MKSFHLNNSSTIIETSVELLQICDNFIVFYAAKDKYAADKSAYNVICAKRSNQLRFCMAT